MVTSVEEEPVEASIKAIKWIDAKLKTLKPIGDERYVLGQIDVLNELKAWLKTH